MDQEVNDMFIQCLDGPRRPTMASAASRIPPWPKSSHATVVAPRQVRGKGWKGQGWTMILRWFNDSISFWCFMNVCSWTMMDLAMWWVYEKKDQWSEQVPFFGRTFHSSKATTGQDLACGLPSKISRPSGGPWSETSQAINIPKSLCWLVEWVNPLLICWLNKSIYIYIYQIIDLYIYIHVYIILTNNYRCIFI